MFRPISTLNLPSATVAELKKKGYVYVEDILNSQDLTTFNINKSEIEKQLRVPEVLALDVWQNSVQRESISICCPDLEAILGNGFQCGVITELSGSTFSGKTQICIQLSIAVQLSKSYGGLDGRCIYIDTRNGINILRFKDIIQGYNIYYKDLHLHEDEAYKNIQVFSPRSLEEFLKIINSLDDELKKIKNNKQVRLVIIDSLSMPILCSIDDSLKRPYYYSQILYQLHKLTVDHNIAIVITNELVMQADKDGNSYFTAAGGQYVADYAYIKLELTRLTNNKFATRLIKSPIMPEMSITFMITQDGIRNVS
ncbi:PREDICTED: DNA repair protein RAD51 homolog 3-like [Ceratosolen solmsi marchali]|uniref:DNA repair protein RAD51 homolog 3 n=1 Tax=Ceratosolen solmsi marchali TaxID=326594 RepID=A0AAJ7DYM9_9HYME|nr:PREDICTED: DNA repair protein RAD51 homolog 3-like [Ceratosolen solmsi marchali]